MIKNKNGFTLIEVMITLSILGIILFFVSNVINANYKLIKSERLHIEYIHDIQMAANHIINTTRECNSSKITFLGDGTIKNDTLIVLDSIIKNTPVVPPNTKLWIYKDPTMEF